MQPSDSTHERALGEAGWTLLRAAVPRDAISQLARQLEDVYAQQRALQLRNGVGDGADGTVHVELSAHGRAVAHRRAHP